MKKIFLGLLIIAALVQTGCKCSRTSDIIGPDACPSDAFDVTTGLVVKNNSPSSTTNLDLLISYASITASFNEVITYKFVITGQTSGAVFQLDGEANAINFNWYGNSTNGKYFVKNEVLSYVLTNLCKTEPLGQGNITLDTDIGYSGFGAKIINFEDSPAVSVSTYGGSMTSTVMNPASTGYSASPQGVNYNKFKATSAVPAWYFGGMDFNAMAPKFASLGTDPTKVYFNFFARGQANSQAQFLLKETAYGSTLTRKFLGNVSPEWKLYSVRLSDIGIINPSAIEALSFNLGAAQHQDTSVELDLDLVIFTFDKPF